MNAREYRVKISLSPIDFPAINSLGKLSNFTQTEPPQIISNKVELKITQKIVLTDLNLNKEYEIFSGFFIYEVPILNISSPHDVYEVFKDATLSLNEAYQFAQKHGRLPNIVFPNNSIETYQKEIGGVFYLINSRN